MSLRFFADHCISNVVIQMLADSVVILKAQELDSILISLNGDFSDIVTYPPANYKGVIALQMRNHPEIIRQLMTRSKNYLSAHTDMDYYKGNFRQTRLLMVRVHLYPRALHLSRLLRPALSPCRGRAGALQSLMNRGCSLWRQQCMNPCRYSEYPAACRRRLQADRTVLWGSASCCLRLSLFGRNIIHSKDQPVHLLRQSPVTWDQSSGSVPAYPRYPDL